MRVKATIADGVCHALGHHAMTGVVNEYQSLLLAITPIVRNFISHFLYDLFELRKVNILVYDDVTGTSAQSFDASFNVRSIFINVLKICEFSETRHFAKLFIVSVF